MFVAGGQVAGLTAFAPAALANTHVHLFAGSAYNESMPSQLGLEPETMDIFVDDAAHDTASMESALRVWWPLVKPGGYYIMEDIEWQRGVYGVLGEPLRPFTQRVFAERCCFWVAREMARRSGVQGRSGSTMKSLNADASFFRWERT